MKTFNLEEALAGKPVVTRDGQNILWVKEVPNDLASNGSTVVAYAPNWFNTKRFYADGRFYREHANSKDLFMASTKKTGYINVYAGEVFEHTFLNKTVFHEQPQAPNRLGKTIHPTQKAADDQQAPNRIGVAVITWEE